MITLTGRCNPNCVPAFSELAGAVISPAVKQLIQEDGPDHIIVEREGAEPKYRVELTEDATAVGFDVHIVGDDPKELVALAASFRPGGKAAVSHQS